MHYAPVRVLLVEDNPADADMTIEALQENKVVVDLTHVEDGTDAMAFLKKEGAFQDAERPDVVLLDLNLPRMDGRDVLRAIKSDPDLRAIPVVILTSSKAEEDIVRSYDLQANSYITKPVGFDQFHKVVRAIRDFWFVTVRLPGGADVRRPRR